MIDPQNIEFLAGIAEGFAVISGVALILFGLFGFKRYAEQRAMMGQQHSMAKPLVMLVCGSVLVALPSFLPAIVSLVFTNSQDENFFLVPGMSPGLLMFLRFLGLCSVIKGIIMLSKTGGYNAQPGMRGKALMHIFCGILLLHIGTVASLIVNFFGI